MTLDEAAKFIGTVGFPIAVTAFLLLRLDRTLRELRDAVIGLTETGNRVIQENK